MEELEQKMWNRLLNWGINRAADYLKFMEHASEELFGEDSGYSQTVLGVEIHSYFQGLQSDDNKQSEDRELFIGESEGSLGELCRMFELDEFEQFCVVMAMLGELEYSFEKLYVYLNNDWNQRLLSVEWAVKIYTMKSEVDIDYLPYFLPNRKLSYCLFDIKSENRGSGLRMGLKLKRPVIEYLLCSGKFRNKPYLKWLHLPFESNRNRRNPDICRQMDTYRKADAEPSASTVFHLKGNGCGECLEYAKWYAEEQKRELVILDYSRMCGEQEPEFWEEALEAAELSGGILCIYNMEDVIKENKEFRQWSVFLRKAVEKMRMLFVLSNEMEDRLSIPPDVVYVPIDVTFRKKSLYSWEDLILPKEQKELLMEAVNQVKYRNQVYEDWGFSQKIHYGTGLSILLTGPPGTGKTMAAQVISDALERKLYKIQLPAVVSKYIGETEKNLNNIFQKAEKSPSVLFFDEADVLFGKRTEVKDSHDKYSNMEAAFLLQKMEESTGVVVLATNYPQNIDEAFGRRIKFTVEFYMPDREQRYMLWKQNVPKELPLDGDVDLELLADQFELSGSNIKNIVVNAAFLAASEQSAVGMQHIMKAIQNEYKKSGKVLTEKEMVQNGIFFPYC